MKNVFWKKTINLLLIAGLIISCVVPFRESKLTTQATQGTVSTSADIQDKIDEAKGKVDEAQSKVDEINEKIDGLTDEQDLIEEMIADIEAEIINTMASIGLKEEEIAAKETEIADKQKEIALTEEAYEEAQATAEKQRDDMMQHIRITYENGSTSYLDLLLSGNGFGDLLNRIDFIEQVYAYDQHMLDNYIEARNQVQAFWEQLEAEERELEAEQEQLKSDMANLEEQKSNLKVMLAKREKESADYGAEIARARQAAAVAQAQLKQEQQELKRLQNQLASQQSSGGGSSSGSVPTGGGGSAAAYGGTSGDSLGQRIADYACQFVGNPYVSGGTSLTNGADCSGFIYRVYKDFNYTLPRTSYEQRSAGVGVSYADAQAGDIICYDGHVALYIGNGKIVHASTERTGIKIGNAQYRTILAVRRIV